MKNAIMLAALLLAMPTCAMAQDASTAASAPRLGDTIQSSDGWPIGKVEYLDHASDGSVTGVAVIHDGRMLHIGAATLTAKSKHIFASSMDHKHIAAM